MHARLSVLAAALLVTSLAACSGTSGGSSDSAAALVQHAKAPVHWVVSLGDSYIAGEGDRWAGNTNGSFKAVDALGTFAYAEPDGLERIPGCHEARLPEVAVNYGDVRGENLACSGAETATKIEAGNVFKPGIDFYHHGNRIGQALALQDFAKSHDVTAVVLSIGGNDFNFSTVLTQCVEDFVTTVTSAHTYCSKDRTLASYFTPGHVAAVEHRIAGSIQNIRTAMRRAGHAPSSYRIIVQDYPSPLPLGGQLRYAQTLHERFDVGGCPVFDRDATWANVTVLNTINKAVAKGVDLAVASSVVPSGNVTLLDLKRAFDGHRLCEQGVGQIQETGLTSWRAPGAANDLEWVNQVYLKGVPWQTQESAHPNYWGTAAERNCLRQVLQQPGNADMGCVRDGTAMDGQEPQMTLTSG